MIDWPEIIGLTVAALLGAIGLLLLVQTLPRWLRKNPEEQWQPVQGTITKAYIQESSGDGGMSYDVRVNYAYRYIDKDLTGNSIAPLEISYKSRESAETVLTSNDYVGGKPVTVFVNPGKPGESVLKPESQVWTALWRSLWGAVFIVGAYFIATHHWTPE